MIAVQVLINQSKARLIDRRSLIWKDLASHFSFPLITRGSFVTAALLSYIILELILSRYQSRHVKLSLSDSSFGRT